MPVISQELKGLRQHIEVAVLNTGLDTDILLNLGMLMLIGLVNPICPKLVEDLFENNTSK